MTQRRIHQDAYSYFITFNTAKGEPWFEEGEYARLLRQEILISAKLKGYDVLALQIMPNHVHLLVSKRTMGETRTLESVRSEDDENISPNPSERSFSKLRLPSKMRDPRPHTISNLMQSIKGNFSYKHKLGLIWQPRFYSRIVNTEKYLTTVVEYMKHNPEKDGLPKRYAQSPYRYFNWRKIRELF